MCAPSSKCFISPGMRENVLFMISGKTMLLIIFGAYLCRTATFTSRHATHTQTISYSSVHLFLTRVTSLTFIYLSPP